MVAWCTELHNLCRIPLEERVKLALSVGEECVQPDELRMLLAKKPNPIAYDGFEPSGRMHIAQVCDGVACLLMSTNPPSAPLLFAPTPHAGRTKVHQCQQAHKMWCKLQVLVCQVAMRVLHTSALRQYSARHCSTTAIALRTAIPHHPTRMHLSHQGCRLVCTAQQQNGW